MLDTFKARLKAKAKTLGVNLTQKRIDAYADKLHKKYPDLTDEADHDTHIEDLHDMLDFVAVAKEDDRIRTLEAQAKKGQEKKEGPDGDELAGGKGKEEGDETATLLKTLIESNKTLQQEIAAIKTKDQQQSIQSKLSGHEKLKAVPAAFWSKRAIPQTEEEIEAFAAEVETDYASFEQEMVTKGLSSQSRPPASAGGASGKVDNDVVSFAKKQSEQTKSKI